MRKLPIGSDVAVRYRKVKDEDGNPLLTGIGTFELKEKRTGTVITSGNLSNVSTATEGKYRAVIDKVVTDTLVKGRRYILTAEFSQSGSDDTRVQEYVADYFE